MPLAYQRRQTALLDLLDQMQPTLGAERFYQVLESADSNYGRIKQFAASYPSMTPAVCYQVLRLQATLQQEMTRLIRPSGGSQTSEATEALSATVAAYNAKLEALLGPDVAAAYRQQGSGRIFRTTIPGGK